LKEQGLGLDDPEFQKCHNLLSAFQKQQNYMKQKQAYLAQQAQQGQQQQQYANTNGVNGMYRFPGHRSLYLHG
jgi:ATP-dependent helicase STH1/SNF2